MRPAILAAALTLLLAAPPAGAEAAPFCFEGLFLVDGDPEASVQLEDRWLEIGDCPPAEARLRATRKGTQVKARLDAVGCALRRPFGGGGFANEMAALSWNVLSGLVSTGAQRRAKPKAPRFKALIAPDCQSIEGRVSLGRTRQPFEASAAPPCEGCPCTGNLECGEGLFCSKAEGACGEVGACALRPGICPSDEWAPRCGCDGRTYADDCDVARAGVSILHAGACETSCGTPDELACAEGEHCVPLPEACDLVSVGGSCVEDDVDCTQDKDPVCGCDGVTYHNSCARSAAGVPLAHYGKCPKAR